METLTKSNIKRLLVPFISTVFLGFIYEVCMTYVASRTGSFEYPIEQWYIANEYMDFLFPIVCVLPFGWVLYVEKKCDYIKYVQNRIYIKKYILNKYMITCLVSSIAVFFIFFLGLLLSLYVIKPIYICESNFINTNFLGIYQAKNPIIFGFILCIFKAFISFLFCSMSILISLIFNNLFIILTTPFIYVLIENYITGMLSIPQYSIYSSFMFNRIDIAAMSYVNLFIPVAVILLINLLLYTHIRIREES